jgi:hypothetical protein
MEIIDIYYKRENTFVKEDKTNSKISALTWVVEIGGLSSRLSYTKLERSYLKTKTTKKKGMET